MDRLALPAIALIVVLSLPKSIAFAQDLNAEAEAKNALDAFITAWNTGEDANLRKTMNFPFVTFGGAGAVRIAERPEDFSQGFDRMREREGWARSSFDFDSYSVVKSWADRVHCEIDFNRYKADGTRYGGGRVFYIVTNRNGRWGVQLRSGGSRSTPLGDAERAEVLNGGRQAALDFMTAFNAGNAEAVVRSLNYPHLIILPGGGFRVAEEAADSGRQNFEGMRSGENWHMTTIDSLEASIFSGNKVHLDIVISRWHPDGTRYLTASGLFVATRSGDHWGIQIRSLGTTTLDARNN
jgi:hypothetical protein